MPNWTSYEMQTFYKTWPTQHSFQWVKKAIWSAIQVLCFCVLKHTHKFPQSCKERTFEIFSKFMARNKKGWRTTLCMSTNIVHGIPTAWAPLWWGAQETTPPPCLNACRTTAMTSHASGFESLSCITSKYSCGQSVKIGYLLHETKRQNIQKYGPMIILDFMDFHHGVKRKVRQTTGLK